MAEWRGQFEMREGQEMAWQHLPVAVRPVLPGTVLTVELPERHWVELDRCAAFARRLMERMNAAG